MCNLTKQKEGLIYIEEKIKKILEEERCPAVFPFIRRGIGSGLVVQNLQDPCLDLLRILTVFEGEGLVLRLNNNIAVSEKLSPNRLLHE